MDMTKIDFRDIGMHDVVKQITKSLTFDLVFPVEVEGRAGFFHSDLTFTMSNGDSIEYCFSSDPSGIIPEIHWLKFNKESRIDIKTDDPVYEIRNIHSERLLLKLSFRGMQD